MALAIREIYGMELANIGKNNEDVVVLDADVSNSTRSRLFGDVFPERFFNVGISEANMSAMAAGMASVGKIPFVNTFAVFISTLGLLSARAFSSYSKLPIKFVGAYGGISDSYDGPSHHALEDIAIMRTLPNLKVFVPCDSKETKWVVKNAIEDNSPMYLRMSRDAFTDVYGEDAEFVSGKGNIIRNGNDLTIIACGLMVGNALKAAEALEKLGLSTRVVDMFCIKPIDEELILKCAKETGSVLCAEEHSVIGGLGSAVAEVLCKSGISFKMDFVGVNDCHCECGSYSELQKKYGLAADDIVEKALKLKNKQ